MKSISPQLLTFLDTQTNVTKADLFQIELVNSQFIYACTAGTDLTFGNPPQRYYSTKYGAWQRGDVVSEASFSPTSNSTEVTLIADSTILYPGTSTSLMATLNAGLFDGAIVKIFTVYWETGQPPQSGITNGYLTTFAGQIADCKPSGRSKVTFDVADFMYILNRPVPPNVIQSQCPLQVGDLNCTFNLAPSPFTETVIAAGGTTTLTLVTASAYNFTNTSFGPLPFYTLGKVVGLTGQNTGITVSVKNQLSATQFQLNQPLPFPVVPGDTFLLIAGCGKDLVTCDKKFNNLIHNRAMPFVPNAEIAQ